MPEEHYLVPEHEQGKMKDIHYSVTAETVEDAEDWFIDAKEQMLDVNAWKKHLSVIYGLKDGNNNLLKRHARRGDRIDVPSGSSNEFMMIDAIEYDDYPDENRESFAMHVVPAGNLLNVASGTFVIERKVRELTACYHGRNEVANGETGLLQIWSGITDIEWASLIKGFLHNDE